MTSTTRRRTRYRCRITACYTRFAIKRHAKREPKCPVCGTLNVRSIEDERQREMKVKGKCSCQHYPFPHQAGTLRMCDAHLLADVEPSDEEIQDYYSCLETQRSESG